MKKEVMINSTIDVVNLLCMYSGIEDLNQKVTTEKKMLSEAMKELVGQKNIAVNRLGNLTYIVFLNAEFT